MKQSAWIGWMRAAIGIAALLGVGCGESTGDDDGAGGEAGEAGGVSGGGASARGGSGGTAGAGAGPTFATPIQSTTNGKVDLLLMIDSSLSMADKQYLLADSLPRLMQGLQAASLDDVHVGIVTSSLGHHGSRDICSDLASNPEFDDRAQLLGSVRPSQNLPSWDASGFLAWDPSGKLTPPGTSSLAEFVSQLDQQLTAAGERGCGYESSLEAWYRFLIDPEPVDSLENDGMKSIRLGTNAAVLAQRQRFLRPDSQVAIVMLTDENDCSVLDEAGTLGWLVGYKGGPTVNTWRMPEATASCATPNSACCRPCPSAPEPGCPDNAAEGCTESGNRSILEDSMNLRCFQHVQRFGIDLLYPVERYVEGLTSRTIDPRLDGNAVANPLFSRPDGGPIRTLEMVTMLGIVGVPWQDLASADSLTDSRSLRFLSAAELASEGRWEIALGDPQNGVPPADPFMIESIEPRPEGAAHPLVAGATISPADATTSMNPINGHEFETSVRRHDLQFACIFPLIEPIPCSDANDAGCDCNAIDFETNSPLCRYPAPDIDGTQEYAKAYPSIRPLQVLRGLGDRGIVASVCPKNIEAASGMTTLTDPNYGYNPAISLLVDRLTAGSAPSCLNRPIQYDATSTGDRIDCHLIESGFGADGTCSCSEAAGREQLGDDHPTRRLALGTFEANGLCGGSTGIDCDSGCFCEVRQLEGTDLTACQNDLDDPAGVSGFCYLDDKSEHVNADLLRHCPTTSKRRIRVLGTSASGGPAILACPNMTPTR